MIVQVSVYQQSSKQMTAGVQEMANITRLVDFYHSGIVLKQGGCGGPHYCSVASEFIRYMMQNCAYNGRAWGYNTYYTLPPNKNIFTVIVQLDR